jgi:hypothetical protein
MIILEKPSVSVYDGHFREVCRFRGQNSKNLEMERAMLVFH